MLTIKLCQKQKIDYIDLDSKLPKDTTVFFDDCHFNTLGCQKVAQIISEYFIAKFKKDLNSTTKNGK